MLVGLGGLTWNLHAKTDLRHAAEEALAIGIRLKDDGIIADAYRNLGRLAFRGKDYAGAQSYFEQSLAVYRAARSEERTGYPLMFMGDIALFEGRWQDAETRYTQTIAIWREVGNKSNLAYPLRRLGSLATQRGDFNRAERLLNESIALNLEVGERQGLAASIAASAALWSARGDENIAVQTLGAVHALLAALHIQLEAADQVEFEHNLAMVRGRLAEASFESAWAEGCSLSLEQAAKMTQQLISVPLAKMETPAPAALPDNSSLTARELDVLRLLAEGLGNQQIADRLVVSAFTVRAHLRAIYGKLGVTTRSAATRYALEHHLV